MLKIMDKIFEKMASLYDPRLNPFTYPDITAQDALIGYLTILGIVKLPKQESTYEVGVNIAQTKGQVIYENHICQLIRFGQSKRKIFKTPIFIIPPWINKYYIFDLTHEKSIIKWLTECGFDVYCISWINADKSHFHIDLDTYIQHGILNCINYICEKLNIKNIHALGYCIGGIGMSLALLKESNFFKSLTFMATPFNFHKMDQLNEHIHHKTYNHIKSIIEKEGVLHGERLSHLFSQLKASEMIYQDVIDRVYLKKNAPLIDYLHWNQDVSNIPGKVHIDYLEKIYLKNTLSHNIKEQEYNIPVFISCGEKDHIVPPKASTDAWNIFSDLHFCIGKGGHVAGIIHNPRNSRYTHKIYKKKKPCQESLDKQNHEEYQTSWWQSWLQWMQPLQSEKVSFDASIFPKIEAAPGRYVKQQANSDDLFF